MIKVMVFLIIYWALVFVEASPGNSMDSETFLEKKKRSAPRGYYGYPFLPYGEPLTILAGLAFIAYIFQTFHTLYHQHNGLGGGILNNVLPGKSRNTLFKSNNRSDVLELKHL